MLGDVPHIILNHSYHTPIWMLMIFKFAVILEMLLEESLDTAYLDNTWKNVNVQQEICWAMTGFSNDFSTVKKQRLFSRRLGLVKDLGNSWEFKNIQAYTILYLQGKFLPKILVSGFLSSMAKAPSFLGYFSHASFWNHPTQNNISMHILSSPCMS